MKNVAILGIGIPELILHFQKQIRAQRDFAIGAIYSDLISKVPAEGLPKPFLKVTIEDDCTFGQKIAQIIFDYYESKEYKTNQTEYLPGIWVSVPKARIMLTRATASMEQIINVFENIKRYLQLDELLLKEEGEMIKVRIKPLWK